MVFARVKGIVLVVNTLLIPIILLALIAVGIAYGERVDKGWQETRTSLNAIASRAKGSVKAVAQVTAKTEAEIKKAVAKFQEVGETMSKVGKAAAKPINAVAKLHVPTVKVTMEPLMIDVPGPIKPFSAGKFKPVVTPGKFEFGEKIAAPFRTIFDALGKLTGPLDDIAAAVRELEKLKALQAQFGAFQNEVGTVAKNAVQFFGEVISILTWLAYVLGVLFLWLAFSYLFWAADRLKRGVALIAHGEA